MNNSENLIHNFYTAFSKKDYRTMQKCYHPDAEFSDPVFGPLEKQQILAMWHMLCEAGKDLQITFGNIGSFDNSVKATWKAVYTFNTGRVVQNEISARFYIQEGLIIQHHDMFDLWKWAQMALGLSGYILGWTDFFKAKISLTAQNQLEQFIKNHPEYK